MEEAEELQSEQYIRTPSIHDSEYLRASIHDSVENEGTYIDELSTLYDPEGSIEIGSILPISAPSQTSIYNEIEELSSLHNQDNNFNDFSEELPYSPSILSTSYNLYNNNLYPRTVPPFYDSTTHREEYTWKYTIPDRFIDDEDYYERYERQARLPEFEGETTNRATYQDVEIVPNSRRSWYSVRESTRDRELPKFEGQTTHREAFTPKKIQRLALTPSTASRKVKRSQPPIETMTTNRKDYSPKYIQPTRIIPPPKDNLRVGRSRSMTPIRPNFIPLNNRCPAEKALKSGIRHSKQRNGHYYFQVQPKSKRAKSTNIQRR